MKKHYDKNKDYKYLIKEDEVKASDNTNKKKKKTINIILDIVIVVLILVAAFLLLKPFFTARRQDEVINEIEGILEENNKVEQDSTSKNEDSDEDKGFRIDGGGIWVDSNANAIEGEELEDFSEGPKETEAYSYLEPLGIIQIDSVDIRLPILKGTGLVPLRYGAGWYELSAPIGAKGRTTILGHSMFSSERFFTRLDRVKAGDNVNIITKDKNYLFKIREVRIEDQYNYSKYLVDNSVDSELLLVTCLEKPPYTDRILVFADLVEARDRA